jgi:hypothetical protein
MKDASFIFLGLFAFTTLCAYIAVRRNWVSLIVAGIGGGLANAAFFTLFSLAQDNGPLHALTVGVLFSALFTVMTLIVAAYFKNNAPVTSADAASKGQGL